MLITYTKPDFVSENEKGTLKQLVHEGWKQVNVITSRPGIIRGGHYHKYNEEAFYIVSGTARLTAWNSDAREEHTLGAGDMIIVPRGVFHEFAFDVETLMVSFYSDGVEMPDSQKDIWTE